MDPAELERVVGEALRGLPAPRAPRTLLPRVMTGVRVAVRPWYARAWRTWPVGWQLASVVVLFGALAVLWPAGQQVVDRFTFVSSLGSDVAQTARDVEIAGTALGVMWRLLVAPVVPYAFTLACVMCLACGLFGTVLNHLVIGKAFR